MEQRRHATTTTTTTNLVEDYATSFQSEPQDHMMYNNHHHLQSAQLHSSYPINSPTTIKRQLPANTVHHIDQNYHSSQGIDDLFETSLRPTPLDTYCNLLATSGSASAHHHYQQQQQPQQQRQLLIPQQHQRQQQQQQQQQQQPRQQHRQQLSPSQYPPYDHRGLAVADHHQQQQQQHQQQHQHLTCSQFVDSQSYYAQHQNNQYLMNHEVNNSTCHRAAAQPDQSQQYLYDEQNQQSVVVVPASHLYSTSEQAKQQAAPDDTLLGDQQQQYHMSVNFSDPDCDQIGSSSQMSSSSMNLYANDQLFDQSPVGSTATTSTIDQDSQHDILVAADQAQYVTHLKPSDLELRVCPSSDRDNNSNSMISYHQHKQTIPAMTDYATQIRQSSATTTTTTDDCVSHDQIRSPNQSMQLGRQNANLMMNGNSPYRSQMMNVNYELELSHVKNSQNYVPTMQQQRGPTGVLHQSMQRHQHQPLPQQHQEPPAQQYAENQAYYDSSGRIVMNSNNMQQQQIQHQQQQQQQQQRIPTVSANNNLPTNSRALVNRPINRKQDDFVDLRSNNGSVSQDWLDTICRHLIDHMNRFGICVIDNFLGPQKGDQIFKEVLQLYTSGQHTRGGLVNMNKLSSRNLGADAGVIRNDRVIWIDGYEEGCSEINNLIQTLCSVITNSARLSLYSNNGLDKTVINKRTKAHVACYPGNGTRYIKHVDNPNGDGRVITSIYYLNKNWNTKQDGGLLRMFPTGINEVANIEPLFDRVLFFWSDRRNPHEVLPAYRDRFAITVWYIGENRS